MAANDSITAKLAGLDAITRKMKGLPGKLQKKYLYKALRKGAGIVRKAAVASAKKLDRKETPNKIYKAIAIQTAPRLGKSQHGSAVRVGVRGGATKENPVFYWRFFEFGTEKMPARPFMLPALESNIGRATDAVVETLTKSMDEAVK